MSYRGPKAWIIGYDIREPRRLQRVHRVMKRWGLPIQYSVFSTELDDASVAHMLASLDERLDARTDDLRVYHVPQACRVWLLGRQGLPDGVTLAGSEAGRLLASLAGAGADTGDWLCVPEGETEDD